MEQVLERLVEVVILLVDDLATVVKILANSSSGLVETPVVGLGE